MIAGEGELPDEASLEGVTLRLTPKRQTVKKSTPAGEEALRQKSLWVV